jgi:acetyl-CoA carboxylase carboxyltransferase component
MWEKETEEIKRRKRIAYQLGGLEAIERQHKKGKMTVRERIDALLDADSFSEIGLMTGQASYNDKGELLHIIPCPLVMGLGKISNRKIAIHGDDFTIKGASVGRIYKAKLAYITKTAHALKVPLIKLLDGAGGSIKEVAEIGYIEIPVADDSAMRQAVELMALTPVISLGLGPVSGIGAMLMVMSHFSVMVKEKSQVFVGGPPLVEAATGQRYSKEELGGFKIHTRLSGVVDNEAEDEEDAFYQAKAFLDYMPSNVWEMPTRKLMEQDDPRRREEELISIVPRDLKKTYDIRKIIQLVFDRNSIFEIGRYQGQSQLTSLARLNGYPVGVLANDSRFKAGAFTWDAAEKFQRFIDMCDTFHIPIVNLVDQPGFFIGKEAEERGTIRKGVRASFSVIEATIPWATIHIRRCFGVAGAIQSDLSRTNFRVAWPSAYWGNIPIEGGVYAAHRSEIESAENPEVRIHELEEFYKTFASPFRAAEHFGIEHIIDPRDTRPLLCDWVEWVYPIQKCNLGVKRRTIRC